MISAHAFVVNLAVVLGVAALTSVLSRLARQPVTLGYLLAGIIVGPHVPLGLVADEGMVKALSELGVILLMFSLGLEFSLRKLFRVAPRAGPAAAIEMGVVGWLGFSTALAFGWSHVQAVFAGASLAISSTMVIARTFREQRVRGPFMELVYGVLIFEDMAAILLITVLTPIAAGLAPEAGAVLDTVGQLGLFVVGFVIVGLSLVPRLFRWVAGFAPTETLLVAGVGLCFVAAWLADAAGYSVALGAFLGGALVAESGAAQKIEPLVQPLRDLFGAVFFVSVGMLIEPALLLSNAGLILLFTVVLMAGKIGGVALGGFLSDGRVRPAVRAGLSMAQVGEFSFIIAGIGVSAGAVGPELLAVAVGVSVLTISTTPLLVRSSARAAHAVHRRMPKALQAFVTFYGAWLDGLRRVARSESSFAALRRTLLWMLVDSVCIVAVAVGMRLVRPSVVAFLHARAGLERDAGQAWVTLATVVLMVPFAVGLFRLGRGLGDTLAGVALPPVEPGRADPAAAPRRAFTLTLQVGVLFAVGLPLVALVQPFLPVLGPLAFMAVAIGAAGVLLWRRMIRLQGHMTAGAEALIEALSRQVASDTGHEAKPLSEECGEMFAGLGRVRSAQIPDAAPTLGRSLGELDVAALTGAQVVAIRRCGRLLPMPGADQRLEAGDEIALLGCEAAVAAARRLLEEGDLPESGAAGAAGAAFGCDQ